MAFLPLNIRPGVNKELPSLTSEPGWYDSEKVRFKNGQPEKIGGWTQTGHGLEALAGIARASHKWRDSNGLEVLCIATSEKLYILYQADLYDITPIRATTSAPNVTFDTVSGSTTVTVNDTTHGAAHGDYVTFDSFTHVDLVDAEVNTNHQITYIDNNTYTIEVTTASTGTTNGVGNATNANYEINVGPESATYAYGWSAAGWGEETWGDERTISSLTIALRIWSLDNFGDTLTATHESGKIYEWRYDISAGGWTDRALEIANAPDINELVVITKPDRHVVALGSTSDDTNQDYMLIRWADQETLTDWTPTPLNTAGDHILAGGSRIIATISAQGVTLIWTDSSLHAMQFVGPPFTFSFNQVGTACGAVSKQSVVSINGVNFWMGYEDFFIYDGVVKPIPCTVHRHVFKDLNSFQLEKVVAGTIREFNEVIWIYPSTSSTEVDRYVIYNYQENIWYNGTLERTTWLDHETDANPIAVNAAGTVFDHESGTDANGAAMTAYIETADFDLDQGDRFIFIRRLLPDMAVTGGSVDYIFKTRRYPHSTQVTDTTLTCTASTEKLDTRIRTRQMAIRIESDALSDAWRMGTSRIDIRKDGGR
jgi:hypothetical protein